MSSQVSRVIIARRRSVYCAEGTWPGQPKSVARRRQYGTAVADALKLVWEATDRSRSYKKNDSYYIEQRNWSVVRRLVGYDRYSSRAALEALNRVYELLRL